jgi:hypothetical protein
MPFRLIAIGVRECDRMTTIDPGTSLFSPAEIRVVSSSGEAESFTRPDASDLSLSHSIRPSFLLERSLQRSSSPTST